MSAFEGSDGGDFDFQRLVGYLRLISIVKIRIREGGWGRVTQLPQEHLGIKQGD
jgi:hypothetical protein